MSFVILDVLSLCLSFPCIAQFHFILPVKAREYVFTGVGLCVCLCLSVTTITIKIVDGFVPNFMGRFLGEREDQIRVSLIRSVEWCGSNGQKNSVNRQLFTFYTSSNDHTWNTESYLNWNSELELEFQEFSGCGKCCQVLVTNFRGELYSLRVLSI